VNKTLQLRLKELIFSKGLTELELCEMLGINIKTWDYVSRGILRPGHNFINELMKILGDEIQLLFIGCYIHNELPRLIPASKYEDYNVIKKILDKIKQVKEKGGDFRYL